MIIRGTPDNMDDYYAAEGEIAFVLQQRGIKPLFVDEEAVYFKKNNKLQKILIKLGVENM